MTTLLIIYVAISLILGIAMTVKICLEFKALRRKWYNYLWAIPLAFILETLGWPIKCIALLVYNLWLKVVS